MPATRRDSALIDSLDKLGGERFSGSLWRVVREGRDPTACSRSGGRWDDATFDVLYTSRERDGALAELHFHLSRGQPVFPSKVRYCLFELRAELERVAHLSQPGLLTSFGVNMARFGQLSYLERAGEYPKTQQIAEVAHFLEFEGIGVPSARWDCKNVVVFCERAQPGAIDVVKDHGLIDWGEWVAANRRPSQE